MVKSPHSQCRGPGFDPLARELEPACLSRKASLHATIKTQGSQIKKKSANEIISFLVWTIQGERPQVGLLAGVT